SASRRAARQRERSAVGVDEVLHGLDRLVGLVLDVGAGLVGLSLALEILVVRQRAEGLLGAALHVLALVAVRHPCSFQRGGAAAIPALPWPYRVRRRDGWRRGPRRPATEAAVRVAAARTIRSG